MICIVYTAKPHYEANGFSKFCSRGLKCNTSVSIIVSHKVHGSLRHLKFSVVHDLSPENRTESVQTLF